MRCCRDCSSRRIESTARKRAIAVAREEDRETERVDGGERASYIVLSRSVGALDAESKGLVVLAVPEPWKWW